jgi:hypothetical protein
VVLEGPGGHQASQFDQSDLPNMKQKENVKEHEATGPAASACQGLKGKLAHDTYPYIKFYIFISYSFYIKSYSGNGRHGLAKLQFVQNSWKRVKENEEEHIMHFTNNYVCNKVANKHVHCLTEDKIEPSGAKLVTSKQ